MNADPVVEIPAELQQQYELQQARKTLWQLITEQPPAVLIAGAILIAAIVARR